MNKKFKVKVISISLIFFCFFAILAIVDNLILRIANLKKNNSYHLIEKYIPDFQSEKLSESNYGQYVKEGSFVNQIIFEHRHHDSDDYVKKIKGKETLWIFGDSWGMGIKNNEKENGTLSNYFNKNDINSSRSIRIIANPSYSPLLMNLAFRNRIGKNSEIPSNAVIFLDQTDLGNDYCDYRPYVFRDKNGRLLGVGRNENHFWNSSKFWSYHLIFREHTSGILFALQSIVNKLNSYQTISGFTDCDYFDILAFQSGKNIAPNGSNVEEMKSYFTNNIKELISEINNINKDTNILLVTHDWAQHYLPTKHKFYMKNSIKDLIRPLQNTDKNIYHLNIDFTKDYPNSKLSDVFRFPKDIYSHPYSYVTIARKIAEKIIEIEKLNN